MKGLVLYSSKYGSTQAYAQELGNQVGFPVVPLQKARDWDQAQVLVLGGWVFAGKVSCGAWMVKHWPQIKDKKVYLFTTSGADKADPAHQKNFQTHYPKEITEKVELFPLNGRMILSKLNFFDRFIMKLGAKMAAKKDPEVAKKMLLDSDRVDFKDLAPLVNALQKHP